MIQDPELPNNTSTSSTAGSELEATKPIVANEFADNEDNEGDIITGPTVGAHVHLAKTASKCFNHYKITDIHTAAASHIHPNDFAADIDQHDLNFLIQKFLYAQTHPQLSPSEAPEALDLPPFDDKITVYSSAMATFYSPSDISGVGGMCGEHIHAIR